MSHPNPSTALARVVMDELLNNGVRTVVISPGSRSAALAIAASEAPGLEVRVVLDERSAAFHALGVAHASGTPAAVVSTSGSAPANFFPALVEADMACVPLVVISADRPAELQGTGANQTIDQQEMYGSKVRRYAGIEAPDSSEDLNESWRRAVADLVAAATDVPPGPVHLNVRFREPTVPVSDDGRTRAVEYPFDTPRIEVRVDRHDESNDLPTLCGDRGLVVAGDGAYDRDALADVAAGLGWPLLATATSGMRGGEAVSAYHHILRSGVPDTTLAPDTVVAVGAIGPSPRLETLLASAAEVVRIDRWGRHIDPERNATRVLRGDPVDLLRKVRGTATPEWAKAWQTVQIAAIEKLGSVLSGSNQMSGALVADVLNEIDWDALVVASSLPIRDVDAHLRRAGPVFANRGASGIDGFVSTALGVASISERTLALAGDLSLLHDSNGFIHDGRIDLTLLVVDNGGGGLFDSLPPATYAPDYERLFITDPGRSIEDLARFHRLRYAEALDRRALRRQATESLDRPGIDVIRVPVDRRHDLEVRAQLDG